MDELEKKLRDHKFIIFAFSHYNTLGAVRSLGEKGIRPIVILHKESGRSYVPGLVLQSKYVRESFLVETIEEGYRVLLDRFGNEPYKPFLYSCDDFVESFLDNHYDELVERFYFFDGGKSGVISRYMDKEVISDLAKECGCNVPKAERLKRGQLPRSLKYPVITKGAISIRGGWKKDVFICENEDELKKAYESIISEELLVEEFINKKNELCLDGFCINHGEDVCIPYQSTYLRVAPGKYGSYMKLVPFTNPVVMNQVKRILKKIGFNGIFSVEFLIDKNEQLYFLEVNFRNSTWSYAYTVGGVNLVYEWAQSTLLGSIQEETTKPIKDEYTAIVELNDYYDFVRTKRIGLSQWIKDLRQTDCLYYYNKNDKRPFYVFLYKTILRSIKKKVIKHSNELV
jgi:D-aspartate ligase